MNPERKIHIPAEGPPQGVHPHPDIYLKMGENNIFKMLSDFYLELERSPLRPMFPEDMQAASKRSAAFFVFLLGGPPLYQQQYGPPMMRKRHLPFIINEQARLTWLKCFESVLNQADAKYNFPLEHLEGFIQFLDKFSSWMVNSK